MLQDALPGKEVLGILVEVSGDGLDEKAEAGRMLQSRVEMPGGHVHDKEVRVINP